MGYGYLIVIIIPFQKTMQITIKRPGCIYGIVIEISLLEITQIIIIIMGSRLLLVIITPFRETT